MTRSILLLLAFLMITPGALAAKPSKQKSQSQAGSSSQQPARTQAKEDASYLHARIGDRSAAMTFTPPLPKPTYQATVAIRIAASGKLILRRIVKSSGNSRMDAAALMIADRGQPYRPLPSAIAYEPLTVVVPIRYQQ